MVTSSSEIAVYENVLSIPIEAVFEASDTHNVMIVSGSMVKQKEIELGIKVDDSYIVTQGLKPGDKIVAVGVESVKDGSQVKIVGQTSKENKSVIANSKDSDKSAPKKAE